MKECQHCFMIASHHSDFCPNATKEDIEYWNRMEEQGAEEWEDDDPDDPDYA